MVMIAKEPLYIGLTLAAMPGNVVSPDAAKLYGWEDKVEDDGSRGATDEQPAVQPKTTRRSRKGDTPE